MKTVIAARIISKMGFSAADYARDKNLIIEEAIKQYIQETGECSEEDRRGLILLLERSFAERKLLSICAIELPAHLKDGGCFSIILNDATEVVGKIRLTPKAISVEIISPFQGEMAGSELEILAPIIWTERPEIGSEANESGRQKSVSLLADLYYSSLR